jgi:serine/threonine-protein kinase
MGTSDYISPEQARGGHVDAQSDIYSLGTVLHEMLTGEVPFPGDNFVSVALRHINEPAPSVRTRRPDVPPRLDAAVRRAMAKDPRDRFASMDELCAELSASLDDAETGEWGAETMVVAPQGRRLRRRRSPRPPTERPSVWPLITLLAGLAVLAGILAAVFTFTGSKPLKPFRDLAHKAGVGGGSKQATTVHLSGVTSYDPEGDNQSEHSEDARFATDGDPGTYWTTEHYSGGLQKNGVGVVVDAGVPKKLTQLVVSSDTPGFTAQVQAGSSSTGPFAAVVSKSQLVGARTTFTLTGRRLRYYVVWITDLGSNSSVHVNEVTAKGR